MFALLPILLDLIAVVHIIRSGRDRIWLYAVVMLPIAGALAYIAIEMLPELYRSYTGQKLTSHAIRKIDPERTLKRHATRLEIADTVQNKIYMAEENVRLGRHDEAAALYRTALTGVYSDDTALLMGLARTTAALGLHAESLDALDRLRTAHPDFQSTEGHLIYARSLEGLGRTDEALDEYAALVMYAAGEETRCRYALLLQRTGHENDATALFDEILKRASRANRRYIKTEREWIDIARRNGAIV